MGNAEKHSIVNVTRSKLAEHDFMMGEDPEAGGASSTARGSPTATDDDEDTEVELNNAITDYNKGGLLFLLVMTNNNSF